MNELPAPAALCSVLLGVPVCELCRPEAMLLTLRMVMHSNTHFVGGSLTQMMGGGRTGRNILMDCWICLSR